MDYESTHILREEIRQLRGTVKAFGIYFVVLSLLPLASTFIIVIMMGSLVGGVTQGIASGISNVPEALNQASDQAKIRSLSDQVEQLQQMLAEKSAVSERNPRPRNNPTMMGKGQATPFFTYPRLGDTVPTPKN